MHQSMWIPRVGTVGLSQECDKTVFSEIFLTCFWYFSMKGICGLGWFWLFWEGFMRVVQPAVVGNMKKLYFISELPRSTCSRHPTGRGDPHWLVHYFGSILQDVTKPESLANLFPHFILQRLNAPTTPQYLFSDAIRSVSFTGTFNIMVSHKEFLLNKENFHPWIIWICIDYKSLGLINWKN